jgi:CIC family chloride channel protein
VGALVSKIILQEGLLFNFVLKQDFNYNNVPFYILLGVAGWDLSVFTMQEFSRRWKVFVGHLEINAYLKAAIGGLMLLAIYFVFPPLFGEGYDSVKLVAYNSFRSIQLITQRYFRSWTTNGAWLFLQDLISFYSNL